MASNDIDDIDDICDIEDIRDIVVIDDKSYIMAPEHLVLGVM